MAMPAGSLATLELRATTVRTSGCSSLLARRHRRRPAPPRPRLRRLPGGRPDQRHSTSRISSIAVGEVLVSGTAEPIELTLVSPLQSAPCLYYRSRDHGYRRRQRQRGLPRGTRGRVPGPRRERCGPGVSRAAPGSTCPIASTSDGGRGTATRPASCRGRGRRSGPGPDRESQIAALLTVRDPPRTHGRRPLPSAARPVRRASGWRSRAATGTTREARIEAGDAVTVVGRVLPFAELADPAAANLLDGSMVVGDRSGGRRGPRRGAGAGAPGRDARRRPGATPRSRASGSAGRSGRRSWIRRRRRRRRPIRRSRPGRGTRSRSRRRRSSSPTRRRRPLLVSLGAPAAVAARHRADRRRPVRRRSSRSPRR